MTPSARHRHDDGQRYLLTCAMMQYPLAPELNRPELGDDVSRMANLFVGEFGYIHIMLGESLTTVEFLDRWRDFCRSSDRQLDDYIVLYFIGHGYTDDLRCEHRLLARDSDQNDLALRTIKTSELIRLATEKTNIRRLLTIVDCCYAGEGGKAMSIEALNREEASAFDLNGNHDTGLMLIAATHPSEVAVPGQFSHLFVRAARTLASGGHGVPRLHVGSILAVMNSDPERLKSQHALWYGVGLPCEEPAFS